MSRHRQPLSVKRKTFSAPRSFTIADSLQGMIMFVADQMRAAISDWEDFASKYAGAEVAEFALDRLRPGDTLRVVTQHTRYTFSVTSQEEVHLNCSRADRPQGPVRISGCGFAFSHAFKPGHLFCGGRMEFTFLRDQRPTRFRTTAIEEISLHQTGEF
jgi:hypothetical protein